MYSYCIRVQYQLQTIGDMRLPYCTVLLRAHDDAAYIYIGPCTRSIIPLSCTPAFIPATCMFVV